MGSRKFIHGEDEVATRTERSDIYVPNLFSNQQSFERDTESSAETHSVEEEWDQS